MKAIVVFLSLVAVAIATDFPVPEVRRGLLLLPKPGPAGYTSLPRNQQFYSANQEQYTPEILRPDFADRRGVYFVEVPQERIHALLAKSSSYSQPSQDSQTSSNQYTHQASAQVNVSYLPLQDFPVPNFGDSSSQYREEEPTYQARVRYVTIPLAE